MRVGARLAQYTTIGVGGPAKYLVVVRESDQLREALRVASDLDVPVLLLGEGSNVVFDDAGFEGLVIVNQCTKVDVNEERIVCEAGAPYSDLVFAAARAGLEGLTFAAGIPGSVGGAVHGNAGAYGRSIGDVLVEATVLSRDGSTREIIAVDELGLDYRTSALKKTGAIVESITVALEPGDRTSMWEKIDHHISHREGRLPGRRLPSAGSFFRNLPPAEEGGIRQAAGKFLDKCGCKGLRIGDAAVFEGHANIIVNKGRATSADVVRLALEMKRRVEERYDLCLEPEVKVFAAGAEELGGENVCSSLS